MFNGCYLLNVIDLVFWKEFLTYWNQILTLPAMLKISAYTNKHTLCLNILKYCIHLLIYYIFWVSERT